MNASNPELQRILAALKQSSSAGLQSNVGNSASNTNSSHTQYSSSNGHVSYANSNTNSSAPQHLFQIPGLGGESAPVVQQSAIPSPTPTTDPRSRNYAQANVPTRAQISTPILLQATIPDASNITTWPAALKHVTKYIIPNDSVSKSIKKLIDSQHTHEEMWAKQREEIHTRHAGRGESTAKIAGLLADLGAVVTMNKKTSAEEQEEKARRELERDKELEVFDRKVYKNLVAMSRDVDKELRRVGVPFYAIKWDLVTETGGQGKLDKGELRELQGRIIEHLELLLLD